MAKIKHEQFPAYCARAVKCTWGYIVWFSHHRTSAPRRAGFSFVRYIVAHRDAFQANESYYRYKLEHSSRFAIECTVAGELSNGKFFTFCSAFERLGGVLISHPVTIPYHDYATPGAKSHAKVYVSTNLRNKGRIPILYNFNDRWIDKR